PAVRAEPCVKRSFLWSQRSFVPNKPLSPPALPSFDALIPSLATNLRSGELSRLGDIVPSDVYQRHREPPTWEWPAASLAPELEVRRPVSTSGPPALVLSLSATVSPDR